MHAFRFSHLYFCQSLNRLQRGLSAIAELLVFYNTQSGKVCVQHGVFGCGGSNDATASFVT